MPWRRIAALIAVLFFCFVLAASSGHVVVDWAWFSSIGYSDVFWRILLAKSSLFAVIFTASALLLWLNGSLAQRFAVRQMSLPKEDQRASGAGRPSWLHQLSVILPAPRLRLLIAAFSFVAAVLIALGETENWDLALRFVYQMPYGRNDPLFDKDIGFYLFSLPVYVAVKNWLLVVLALSTITSGFVYWVHGGIDVARKPWHFSSGAIAHGSFLIGLYFVLMALSNVLGRYMLLYNDNGVVHGANYTDVHLTLPLLWLLACLAAAAALVAWINIALHRTRQTIAAAALFFCGSFVFAGLLPSLFERFFVKPSELQLETPFIQSSIDFTREAYNLHHFKVTSFPAEQTLTSASLQGNRDTTDNIRLWDWQPLMDTFAQLQEIRTYYKFFDVDVDRYKINGSYQQVTLAARELAASLLPREAQTWVNLHLLFTHGIGAVMSPVTQKSKEGLPLFYLKDIPPAASEGPSVTEPRLYFGEGPAPYVIVNGSTKEFDYPRGTKNIYTSYSGVDGVTLSGSTWRSLFAWSLGDLNILLSRYLSADSRILLHRNIRDRMQTVAPFLQLDHDPYLVISDGRLFWMQDAYTTSSWFPYAQPYPGGSTNYIRNSVKITVDAYNGTITFYLADPADPVIATYRQIFPTMFKSLDTMPADLRNHIRYPEDLFLIQALQYRTYHMSAPEVFYNREDLWQFPRDPTGPTARDGSNRMEPFYIITRLPGDTRAEFFLMLPMVPSERENMIALLVARCDAPAYGQLVAYEFPKDKLVYGPFQIEALINQNTDISQQISLWNQMGSRVVRGNLLVVPIDDSILYVSPLYLRAETGQLPELKRVIAAYGDRVVMEETLPAALAALFGAPAALKLAPESELGPLGAAAPLAHEALDHYEKAIGHLKLGDWGGFGAELDAMRPLLEQLDQAHK